MPSDQGKTEGPDGTRLTRDVQEHLGRRLRSELHIEEAKPAFLGDEAIPPQFERFIRRLEAGERGQRQGYEAVKAALGIGAEVPVATSSSPETGPERSTIGEP